MPKSKDGGKLYRPPKIKPGRAVEVKYRHSSLQVRQGKDGGPELKCPSCEEWFPPQLMWVHNCKKPIVEPA